jgi:hypothetical protein
MQSQCSHHCKNLDCVQWRRHPLSGTPPMHCIQPSCDANQAISAGFPSVSNEPNALSSAGRWVAGRPYSSPCSVLSPSISPYSSPSISPSSSPSISSYSNSLSRSCPTPLWHVFSSSSTTPQKHTRVPCEVDGCAKYAVRSNAKTTLRCPTHLRELGLRPAGKLCAEEGCDKEARTSTAGSRLYCKAHMRQLGLQPLARLCAEGGCGKQAKSSTTGKPLYCQAHMRQHGLEPATRRCAEEGCGKEAKISNDGARAYCHKHMRAHGLQPAAAVKRS